MIIQNRLKKFSVIPKELIMDNTISDRARFMFCWMASMPDDWDFYMGSMSKALGYSEDTVRKYIKELCDSGWLVKGEQTTGDDGRYGAVAYTINEQKFPKTEITVSEKFRDGKSPTHTKYLHKTNTDSILNTDNKKKESIEKDLSFVEEVYRESMLLYLDYRKKIGKPLKPVSYKTCYEKLKNLSGGEPAVAREIVAQTIGNGWQGLFELKDKKKNERAATNHRLFVTPRDPNEPERNDLPF